MKIRKTFKDYLDHGITPYGACLNTLDDIAMRLHGIARRRAEETLIAVYREYSASYNRKHG